MPYNIQVLDYVDQSEVHVGRIGAANTVINNNGTLMAYNTDYEAAKTVLDRCPGLDLSLIHI